jgi:hypothetical protein
LMRNQEDIPFDVYNMLMQKAVTAFHKKKKSKGREGHLALYKRFGVTRKMLDRGEEAVAARCEEFLKDSRPKTGEDWPIE